MSVRIRSVAARRAAMLCLLSAVFVATAARSQGASSLLDSRATAVAAGTSHDCTLTTGGGVQCWGGNNFGQLGNGSTTDSALPVAVINLSSGVAAIAASDSYSCALTMSGGVQCWGLNQNGQLGNGSTSSSSTPVSVTNLSSGVAAITVGEAHSCALMTSGGVQCWGLNSNGQLGNGSTTNSSTPVAVANLSGNVVAIVAGGYHTCALTSTGVVQCWGQNSQGQLGNGSTTDSSSPVTAANLGGGVTAIAAGYRHTCALPVAGGVQCWGYNVYGQLGNGSNSNSLLPGPVASLAGSMAKIAAGKYQTCVLNGTGSMQCWGWNTNGQLGNGSTANSTTPVTATAVPGGAAMMALGTTQTCVLTAVGGVQCFGANSNGQLGNGTTASSLTPVVVNGFSTAVAVAVATRSVVINGSSVAEPGGTIVLGYDHTCALTNAGGAQCWGLNNHGQLGNNSTSNTLSPVAVTNFPVGIAALAAGSDSYHTCALTTAGGAQCWGLNNQGELGNGSTTDSSVPVAVTNLASDVAALAAGNSHTCALTTAGGVQCWGANLVGQLGNGTTTNSSLPVGVAGLDSGVVAIAAGLQYSCALLATGGVRCWGWNLSGQLGNGSTTDSSTPVTVTNLAGTAVAIAAGTYHACALLASGAVQCWGLNSYGELGNGSTTNSSTPVAVTNLAGSVTAIAAGGYHTCALTTSGTMQCWGRNLDGQLGNNSTKNSSVPVTVANLASGAVAVAAGDSNICALTNAGGLQCWGNGYGKTPSTVYPGVSLSFNAPLSLPATTSVVLSATTSNGGTATYDSWTPDTCTLADPYSGTLTGLKPGLCGVRASKSAYGMLWADAPQQLRLIRITNVPPTLTLSTSGSPSAVGASVTFTATLANATSPSGAVLFCADAATTNASCGGAKVLCEIPSNATPIACSTNTLAAGSHTITAYFVGDANNSPAATAGALTQAVGSAPAITSANAVALSVFDTVGFTVTTSGAPAPSLALAAGDTLPSGVQFLDNGNGMASLYGIVAPGSVGTYTLHITAHNVIGPDATQTLTIMVNKEASTVALAASPASIVLGQSTTLTATINVTYGQPGGTVSFTDKGTVLPGCGAVPLAALAAQCPTANPAAGSHSITATYMGDANTAGASSSPPTVVTVQVPGTSIALNDSGQTLCDNGAASGAPLVVCTAAIVGDGGTYPRQDARFGRDAAAAAGAMAKIGGGANGFDFTKICYNGMTNCAGNANTSGYTGLVSTDWVCTKDNVTGLVWALYINNNGYWFQAADSSSTTNDVALANANSLCGFGTGWRLPTRRELLSIVDYGAASAPLIDTNYFPGTGNFYFWSGDTYLPPPQFITSGGPFAWLVDFNLGGATFASVRSGARVRVVHSSP